MMGFGAVLVTKMKVSRLIDWVHCVRDAFWHILELSSAPTLCHKQIKTPNFHKSDSPFSLLPNAFIPTQPTCRRVFSSSVDFTPQRVLET
jgi:hypothetical protein